MKKTLQLILLGLTLNMNAQINYYDITPDIVLNSVSPTGLIDVDNNAVNDILVSLNNSGSKFVSFSRSTGLTYLGSQTTTAAGTIIDRLALNEVINSTKFYQQGVQSSCVACISWNAQWFSSVTDAYFGFRATFVGEPAGTYHYGWMRVDVVVASNAVNSITIKDFGWEQTAGVGITAGSSVLSNVNFISKKSFSLYPNPLQNEVTIDLHNLSNAKLVVLDINGRLLKEHLLNRNENKINTNDLPSGIYLFEVTTNEEVSTVKVVKQ